MHAVELAHQRVPSPEWRNHVGTPNSPSDRYPVAPPLAIGRLLSATTFLSATGPKLGRRLGAKITLVVCMFLLGALLPGLLTVALSRSLPAGITAAGLSGLIGSVVTLGFLRRRMPVCSFVGDQGFARCTGLGRRVAIRAVRFAEVADAAVRKVHVTLAGGHVATRYEFCFANADRRPLLAFTAFQGRSGPTSETDEAFFGLSAVEAWQRHRAAVSSRALD